MSKGPLRERPPVVDRDHIAVALNCGPELHLGLALATISAQLDRVIALLESANTEATDA